MSQINPISIESESMAKLRKNIDKVLTGALSTMKAANEDEATITVKIKVSLEKSGVTENGNWREVLVPTFEHDVSSTVQIKDKISGKIGGADCELVNNKEDGTWGMRTTRNQVDMFEEIDGD